jgi:lipopolysaccharide export LptBFGC system permease protein LptF
VLRVLVLQTLVLAPAVLPLAVGLGASLNLLRWPPRHHLPLFEVVGFASATALLVLLFSFSVAPWAARTRDALLEDPRLGSAWDSLAPGAVIRVAGWRLSADAVDSGGDRLERVVLRPPGDGDTLFARRAQLERREARGEIVVTLEQGASLASEEPGVRPARFDLRRFSLPSREPDSATPTREAFEGMPWRELSGWARGARDGSGDAGSIAGGVRRRRLAAPLLTLLIGVLSLAVATAPRLRTPGSADPRAIEVERRAPAMSIALRPRRFALARQIAGRFAGLLAVCLCGLVVAGVAFDVADHMLWLGSQRATGSEWLRFHLARVPWVVAALLPLALAVAAALLVNRLAAGGDLVAMRASGMSDPQIVLPAIVVCALLVPAPMLLRGWEAVATSSRLDSNREWRRAGPWLLEAASFDRQGAVATGMTAYRLDDEGLPAQRIDAWRGRPLGGGVWRFQDPLEGGERGPIRLLELGETPGASLDVGGFGTGALVDAIVALEEAGFDARRSRAALHARLAETLACVVLPALVFLVTIGRHSWVIRGRKVPAHLGTALTGAAVGALWMLLVVASARAAPLAPMLFGWTPGIVLLTVAGFAARCALHRYR